MKSLLLFFLLLPGLVFGYAKPNAASPTYDYKSNQSFDFVQQPVKLLEAAYMDHHFWQVERGLKRVEQALKILNPLHAKNPNQLFAPDKFKHAKVYEIKSTVHVLKSLLLHRKALSIISAMKDEQSAEFKEMMGDKGSERLSIKDMEKFAILKEESFKVKRKEMEKLASLSMKEMEKAVEVDKTNPVAYFQYGKLLNDFMAGEKSKDAEKQFFMAGKLSWAENDKKGWNKSIAELEKINPNSGYLTELKNLN